MVFKNLSPNDWIAKEDENLKLLSAAEQWDSIPLLNALQLDKLCDNTLVRFRGMVQDMANPEFYYDQYEVKDKNTGVAVLKNGKYCDSLAISDNESVNFHSKNNVTKERHTMVLISIPGTNKWAEDLEREANKEFSSTSVSGEAENPATKRTLEECDSEVAMETNCGAGASGAKENKKHCSENNTDVKGKDTKSVSLEDNLNFPLVDRKGKVCQVKIYRDADSIKLNEVLEVVGFVSFDRQKSNGKNKEMDTDMEVDLSLPASLVPRIHCVSLKKLIHSNPLVKTDDRMDSEQKQCIRKDLLILLTQLLLGDQLAAEYLLFYLISRTFGRVDSQPLGKFTLNVSNVPSTDRPNYVKEIYEFIEMLVTKSHYFPMTLENMNTMKYLPEKNYELECLRSGLLQLSNQTHLVLDETLLKDGTLQAMGVIGVQNIKKTIETQTVTYDFGYYQMEFETDISFLIFSEGKTMLSSDYQVKLSYDQETVNTFDEVSVAAKHYMKPEFLSNVRKYLTLAQHAEYEVSEDMVEQVQGDFLEMRKGAKATADDLQNILVVARMLSLSLGKSKLDGESWTRACELERQRKMSLKSK